MKFRRFSVILVILLGIFSSVALLSGGARLGLGNPPDATTPIPLDEQPYPDAYKLVPRPPAELPVPGGSPDHLTHPCGGMLAEPTFSGVSPLSIAYVSGMCGNGYGDIGVWQANGHSYVAQSGFAVRMFHIWNVDDPYNPQILITQSFPAGGTASTALFDFKQTTNDVTHYYMAVAMRGSGTGCGYFIYNVDDPANPVLRVRKAGTDWCTVHETFVSTDTNGSADYAWLTMSGESGSGYKIVVLTLPDLSLPGTPVLNETGRYQRSDSNGSDTFIHDSNVVGNRVYVGHWQGGMLIFDKQTLATTIQPAPLNPINSIRPVPFWVHHTVPTTDGKFAFIEDEFINSSSSEKIKVYNITDVANPVYAGGIIGSGNAATSQAHNMVIQPISPGLDRLFVGWYKAGMRMFEVNTSGATPVITETGMHQLRATTGSGFGGMWGVDYLPCTLKGQPHTCIYSSDYEKFGLVVDAVGYDPMLDPYAPESAVTSPTNGQVINGCSFTISGTAHDYYSNSTLQRVEVSTDNGGSWQTATGTTSWTYNWNIPGNGPYTIQARAVDVAGNIQTLITGVPVTVSGCTGGATATSVPATNTAVVPSNTPVPPTNTAVVPTSTATVQASPTIGPPCGYILPNHTTSCEATTYNYSFVWYVESGCGSASGTANLMFEVGTSSSGPWTIFDEEQRQVTMPGGPGNGGVSGFLTETGIPAQYTHYRISISALMSNGAPLSGQTQATAICETSPTETAVPPTTVATAISTSTATATGIPTSCTVTFTDVPPDNTFYTWIRCLACRGVFGGYTDGTFRPGNDVTRGQFSKIASNAAGYNDEIPSDRQTFEDVPSDHPFWLWIERLALHGVIGGYECGSEGEPCVPPDNRPYFRPYANITRGQISKILCNITGCEAPSSSQQTYEDVPVTNTFWQYIEGLSALGVMGGYPCGGAGEPCMPPDNRPYFRPNANATRGQVAKMVANTFFPNCDASAQP
ncbi:MAG TPA: S-layer homology domain-containing protein [Chloroflexia bacterium]|nr:S-layer homology domain-containing protein [Chloroflexia bacterium]